MSRSLCTMGYISQPSETSSLWGERAILSRDSDSHIPESEGKCSNARQFLTPCQRLVDFSDSFLEKASVQCYSVLIPPKHSEKWE